MDNRQKLREAFVSALGIEENIVKDNLKYNSISQWDSVAHMNLIATIEEAFDIMLDTDDVIDMSSFGKAKEILIKYGITF